MSTLQKEQEFVDTLQELLKNTERSKLKELSVKGLFGEFDYKIPLTKDSDDGISIITAPNGYGKSTILKIIKNVNDRNFKELLKIEFKNVTLTNNLNISLNISYNKLNTENPLSFKLRISKLNKPMINVWNPIFKKIVEDESEPPIDTRGSYRDHPTILIRRHFPEYQRIAPSTWLDPFSKNKYTAETLINQIKKKYNDYIFTDQIPKWLILFTDSFEVLFVSANRLKTNNESKYGRLRPQEPFENVQTMLSDYVRNLLESYLIESRKLEQGFPNKIIQKLNSKEQSTKEIVLGLFKKIQEKENRFQRIGLITNDKKTRLLDQELTDSSLLVLETLFEDMERKYSVFEDGYEKLNLFESTINSMFRFKKILISRNTGFSVISSRIKDIEIPVSSLSSGEQHLIVLLGELIFKTSSNTLLLLDEPEISFHPEWQEYFINVIKKIILINSCKVLIATHSPMLIQDNWDDVIELANQVKK